MTYILYFRSDGEWHIFSSYDKYHIKMLCDAVYRLGRTSTPYKIEVEE